MLELEEKGYIRGRYQNHVSTLIIRQAEKTSANAVPDALRAAGGNVFSP